MLDVEVSIYCEGCGKYQHDEDVWCPDCYDKLKTERDALLVENERLKDALAKNNIPIPDLEIASPYCCPALAEMLKLPGKRFGKSSLVRFNAQEAKTWEVAKGGYDE